MNDVFNFIRVSYPNILISFPKKIHTMLIMGRDRRFSQTEQSTFFAHLLSFHHLTLGLHATQLLHFCFPL